MCYGINDILSIFFFFFWHSYLSNCINHSPCALLHISILVYNNILFVQGMPGSVQIFGSAKELQSQPVARKSFFRCSTVQLNWNSGSTGLLVVVQSDVDKTNQSYYGESKLNYLTTDGSYEGLVALRTCSIPVLLSF